MKTSITAISLRSTSYSSSNFESGSSCASSVTNAGKCSYDPRSIQYLWPSAQTQARMICCLQCTPRRLYSTRHTITTVRAFRAVDRPFLFGTLCRQQRQHHCSPKLVALFYSEVVRVSFIRINSYCIPIPSRSHSMDGPFNQAVLTPSVQTLGLSANCQ